MLNLVFEVPQRIIGAPHMKPTRERLASEPMLTGQFVAQQQLLWLNFQTNMHLHPCHNTICCGLTNHVSCLLCCGDIAAVVQGMRKPAAGAYQAAASHLQLPPERLIFVDDRQPNVDAAAASGMKAIRFTGCALALEKELQDLGLQF